jgi:putative ABC transport system permease protein
MHSVLQDIRFGIRILLRSPGITAGVILALALGIGANSAMFSVVDALILHPLRYPDPSTLVAIWDRDAQGTTWTCSAANFLEWRKAKTLSEVGAWTSISLVLTGVDRPVQTYGARVTTGFFRTLGVKPVLGRTFLVGEDGLDGGSGLHRVAVIGYQLWQGTFGADPNVLGRSIVLNDAPYTIVGVMPQDFQFIDRRHQVWVPVPINPGNHEYRYLTVIGRRAVRREAAASELGALARVLAEDFPKSNRGWTVQVDDFQEWLVGRPLRTRLLLLFSAVGLVLLLACINVAGLLFVRSAARTREVGVRLALGAMPGRVVRQLLTESVLLAVVGGALGLAFAGLLIDLAPRFVPAEAIPTTAPIELNALVLYFTLGISVVTGIMFGVAPALSLSRTDLRGTLNDSSRGSTAGRGSQRFRQTIVTVQVAAALVLLTSAGLMAESLRHLSQTDLGFKVQNVLTLRIFLPTGKYDPAHAIAFHRRAMEKIAALPGVASVAMASSLPLNHLTVEAPFDLDSAPPRDAGERPTVGLAGVTAGYLDALGIPLKRGRAFSDADTETSPPVAMVNDAFAALHFRNEDPVGRHLLLNRPGLGKNVFGDTVKVEIVGVTGNVKLEELSAPPEPIVYVPLAQNVSSATNWLAVRTHTNPASLSAPIRQEITDMDRDQPVDQTGSMEQTFHDQFAEPRFQSQMMSAFAALALVLAVVGIYGVNAFAVIQRRREFGIRVALGASPGDLLRDTVGQGMKLTGIGIALGLAGAVAVNSALRSILVGVSATDPLMLLGSSAFLAMVAAVACYIPARRAMRIDPASALRQD